MLLSKHLQKTRSGICIYKTSPLHLSDDYIGFTPSCSPTFHNKLAPMQENIPFSELQITRTRYPWFVEIYSLYVRYTIYGR